MAVARPCLLLPLLPVRSAVPGPTGMRVFVTTGSAPGTGLTLPLNSYPTFLWTATTRSVFRYPLHLDYPSVNKSLTITLPMVASTWSFARALCRRLVRRGGETEASCH
jgi:hypothetical protein